MKILSLGSLNIDYVYSVDHINLSGETISASERETKQGGKGLNQSIALARAGAQVFMAGCMGADGGELLQMLDLAGVDTRLIRQVDGPSGHAIIQLAASGENAIIIYGGANLKVTPEMIDQALTHFQPGDYILLQNEISCVDHAIRAAKAKGMKVVFNPSPISRQLTEYPLELVDLFILNQLEGQTLARTQAEDAAQILQALACRFPQAQIVLTLGKDGAVYQNSQDRLSCKAYHVPVVDTTGAGDTFCGYFLAELLRGSTAEQALTMASQASALAIGKKGAAVSIPTRAQVEQASLVV